MRCVEFVTATVRRWHLKAKNKIKKSLKRLVSLPTHVFLACVLAVDAQVVLVGSSVNERDQMLFISTDEGSSFQRQSVVFTPATLVFHPKEEDKLLAYCKDGRVRSQTFSDELRCTKCLTLTLVSPAVCLHGFGPQVDFASGASDQGQSILVSSVATPFS